MPGPPVSVLLTLLLLAPTPSVAQSISAEDAYFEASELFTAKRYEAAYEAFRRLLLRGDVEQALRTQTLFGLGSLARKLLDARPEIACEGRGYVDEYLRLAPRDDPQHAGAVMDARAGRETLAQACDAQRAPERPAEAPVTARAQPDSESGGANVPAWLCTVGAVVGAGAGVALLVLADDSAAEADEHLELYSTARDPEAIADHRGDAKTADDRATGQRVGGIVSLGAAAALTGVAAWLFLRDDSATVTLAPTPSGGHLVWTTRW